MITTAHWPRMERRGQALITIALALVALMGFAGLAIDVGMMMVARNELQNGADASASPGPWPVYKDNAGVIGPTPNWTRATDSATKAITFNKVNKAALATGTVTTGYWNLTGTPSGMQSKTKSPLVTGDAAAVSVQIRKAPGQNGGYEVALFLAPLLGITSEGMKASAVGVVSYPSSVGPHETFPTAINFCMYQAFWDFTTNQPKLDPLAGQPYVFRIGSSYHYGACDSGQWTSMFTDNNDVPTVRDLIDNGNPTAVKIGDQIWIQPGTKTSLYNDVIVPSTALLPVVQDVASSTHALATVLGFGPFMITASVGGSGKYIEGHFVAGYQVPSATGGGPAFGAYVPPTLAQ